MLCLYYQGGKIYGKHNHRWTDNIKADLED